MDALSSFSVHPVSEPPTKSRGESKKQKEPVQKREETTPKTIPVDLKPRTKPMMKPSKATILKNNSLVVVERNDDTGAVTISDQRKLTSKTLDAPPAASISRKRKVGHNKGQNQHTKKKQMLKESQEIETRKAQVKVQNKSCRQRRFPRVFSQKKRRLNYV